MTLREFERRYYSKWFIDEPDVYYGHKSRDSWTNNELIRRWRNVVDKFKENEPDKTNVKETKMNNETMRSILFLAPGYAYAKKVIENLLKDLDSNEYRPYYYCTDPDTVYFYNDKVRIDVIHTDPVKWTPDIFMNRDAIYGRKELLKKAHETFPKMRIFTPDVTLSKCIRDMYLDPTAYNTKPRETYIPEIKNVYFNNPVTVVIWEDGTKTMVRCQEGDVYSPETGLALCIAKKALGNMPNFNNVFRKWIPEEETGTITLDITMDDLMSSTAKDFASIVNDTIAKFKGGFYR